MQEPFDEKQVIVTGDLSDSDVTVAAFRKTITIGENLSIPFNEKKAEAQKMKRITTVCGDIQPEMLGFTTIHEHPLGTLEKLAEVNKHLRPDDPYGMLSLRLENAAWLRADHALFSTESQLAGDETHLIRELLDFKNHGGNAVVDASADGLRLPGDVFKLQAASAKTGIHIVTCAGFYLASTRPDRFVNAGKNEQKDYLEALIADGIDGSNIRPGFLKCAVGALQEDGKFHASELDTLRACAEISKQNGMAVQLHPAEHGKPILDLVEIALGECGMEPDNLIILHQDSQLRTRAQAEAYVDGHLDTLPIDLTTIHTLLQCGVNISFDTLTHITDMWVTDMDKMKVLIKLLREGWGDHVVLGHDIINKPRGASFGGYGYKGFSLVYLPVLRRFGLEEEIKKMTVTNPARILSYPK